MLMFSKLTVSKTKCILVLLHRWSWIHHKLECYILTYNSGVWYKTYIPLKHLPIIPYLNKFNRNMSSRIIICCWKVYKLYLSLSIVSDLLNTRLGDCLKWNSDTSEYINTLIGIGSGLDKIVRISCLGQSKP